MKKLFAIILAGLVLPVFCFGAVSYDRTPVGSDILSPITIDVSFDTWETDVDCAIGETWSVVVQATDDTEIGNGEWYASTTKEAIFVITLPVDDYYFVGFVCNNSYGQNANGPLLEGGWDPEIILFSVSGQAPGEEELQVFELPGVAIGSTTAMISDLVGSIGPFIWLFIGIPLGFVVVKRIIKIIPK